MGMLNGNTRYPVHLAFAHGGMAVIGKRARNTNEPILYNICARYTELTLYGKEIKVRLLRLLIPLSRGHSISEIVCFLKLSCLHSH